MRLSIRSPHLPAVRRFLKVLQERPLSYSPVGITRAASPEGFDHDFSRVKLGRGNTVWNAARTALDEWRVFPESWTKVYAPAAPDIGVTVAVGIRLFGLWWTNACRVVYTIDTPDRYGWAYGTLSDHFERGEECFWIERDRADNVWYCIRAMSRPNRWWVWLAYPFARRQQARFREESMRQMQTLTRTAKAVQYEMG